MRRSIASIVAVALLTSACGQTTSLRVGGHAHHHSVIPHESSAPKTSPVASPTPPAQPPKTTTPLVNLNSVAMVNAAVGFGLSINLNTSLSQVVRTSDGGHIWSVVDSLDMTAEKIVATDPEHAYLVANNCRAGACNASVLLGTSDGGKSWTTIKATRSPLLSLSFISSNTGWVAEGSNLPLGKGQLLVTSDGGSTWSTLAFPCAAGSDGSAAMDFLNAQDGWMTCTGDPGAGMADKVLYATTDGGSHWSIISTVTQSPGGPVVTSGLPLDGYVHDLFFLSPMDGWAAIDRVGVFQTTDGGRTWGFAWPSSFQIGTDNAPSVGFSDKSHGWVVETDMAGSGATLTSLYTTHNAGATWQMVYPAATPQN